MCELKLAHAPTSAARTIFSPAAACSTHTASLGKDDMAVLDNKLHSEILRVHIRHLPLNANVPHDAWRKDNCDVLG
jgi:hypothetical protein